ncbi:MAG: HpcH/HpaI aldolase/citrate lyase family protein [Tsuneonella sp.]
MDSWLIVPAANEKKLARVGNLPAGAIVLDLTDALSAERREEARARAAAFLTAHRRAPGAGGGFARWVRINALETPWWREDLLEVLPGAPDGIVLAHAAGPSQVQALAAEIYEREQRSGVEHGRVRIVPQVAATPAAALTVGEFAGEPHPRLAGLAWDAGDLAHALGARRTHGEGGGWIDPLRRVRADVVLAARARGLMAIETLHRDVSDAAGMRAAARAARGDGFTGMFAVHPAQLPLIAEAFAPTAAERAEAQAIVSLFEASPQAAMLSIDGRLIDRTALEAARRLVAS